ncbi:ClpP/crotonase-like domain-containing protein [Catenaria anguillulae PL171]|uniref:ClpP/crotonase-like domain-containing protein n=1 Tax=Catenaria anguillulae PL171 TaxID=765915 RepID=A0A1Y2HBA1_9FUNG|nr:ClpP/crotonase-like domain-containing protein [Catenaria anguillulae PL171]
MALGNQPGGRRSENHGCRRHGCRTLLLVGQRARHAHARGLRGHPAHPPGHPKQQGHQDSRSPIPRVEGQQGTADLELIDRGKVTRELVSSLIHFPKLLVAGVNGPAIGFACTTLALFDFVFAAKDQAWFHTPFMQWGFCAEGCSSVTFPRIFGPGWRTRCWYYLGQKYSAEELLPSGFITELLPADTFQRDVINRTVAMAKQLPPQSFATTKRLVHFDAHALDEANYREMNALIERMSSEECEQRIAAFFAKKAKNKAAKAKL